MLLKLPKLYAVIDVEVVARREIEFRGLAEELAGAGVGLVQLRYKGGQPREVLRAAAVIREIFAEGRCHLVMNDRADLAVLAGWDGVHVGQGDLSVEDARRVFDGSGTRPAQEREGGGTQESGRIVGVSTHTEEQVREADKPMSQERNMGHTGPFYAEYAGADYVAIGPVFRTGTKLDVEPVVGLEGVRLARALTAKPLVAIGGITRENARSVIEAGADSVAVISGLFAAGETVGKVARDFLELLR